MLALSTLAVGVVPAVEAQTSVSIYSDGRVVVRRTLPQALKRGRSELTVTLEGFDPATLFSPDTAVAILAATLRAPTDRAAALAAAAGRMLSFVRAKGDTVRATVVRTEPPQYRLPDGRVLLDMPGEPLLPSELVRTAPEATIVVEASRARPRTELAYVAQGATWEAVYQVLLGPRTAAVSGTATVTSQGLRVADAEVQLVAGSVRRARAGAAPAFAGAPARALAASVAEEMGEESVGETHVYSLPDRLSIEPEMPTATAMFPRATAACVREFVVPGAIPWRGFGPGQAPDVQHPPVQVWYTVRRARQTAFGDRPLPAGTVQLYEPDSDRRVQLVGESAITHTPAGADVRIQAGDAFNVTAERVQTDYRVEDLPGARRGVTRRRVTAAFRVTVSNARSEAVTVDVRERHAGEWRILESSVPMEKLSAAEVRFRVAVPPEGQTVLTYTVQVDS